MRTQLIFARLLGAGVLLAMSFAAFAQAPAAAPSASAKVVGGFNPYVRNCAALRGTERAYCEARNRAAEGCAEYLASRSQMIVCLQVNAPSPPGRSCDEVSAQARASCVELEAQNAKCNGRDGVDRWNCRLANAKPLEQTDRRVTAVAPLPPTPAKPEDRPVISREPEPLSERLKAGPPPGWTPEGN